MNLKQIAENLGKHCRTIEGGYRTRCPVCGHNFSLDIDLKAGLLGVDCKRGCSKQVIISELLSRELIGDAVTKEEAPHRRQPSEAQNSDDFHNLCELNSTTFQSRDIKILFCCCNGVDWRCDHE